MRSLCCTMLKDVVISTKLTSAKVLFQFIAEAILITYILKTTSRYPALITHSLFPECFILLDYTQFRFW